MSAHLLLRRLAFLVFVILGLSLITFLLSHIVPTDPVRLFAGPRASAATLLQLRHQLGFDRPLLQQYLTYAGGLLHGDFGYSLASHRAVSADLYDFLPATLEMTAVAVVLVLLVGVPLGVISAVWRGSPLDWLSRAVSITGVSFPAYWLALLAQFLFFAKLGWLPEGGRLDPTTTPPHHVTGLFLVDSLLQGSPALFWQSLSHLLLPSAVLGYGSLAVLTRMVRSSMLEALVQDYVRTARAKGLVARRVVLRHALRNALLPATTVMGLQIGYLLGGAVLVEDVFSWPGVGRYATLATESLDYNAIMAVTLVAALIYVVTNLAVDLLYATLDPKLSYG